MSLFSKSDSKFDERIADLTLVDHFFFFFTYFTYIFVCKEIDLVKRLDISLFLELPHSNFSPSPTGSQRHKKVQAQ